MSPFVWWVVPLLATVLATSWAAWVRRERKPPAVAATVEEYARLLAALRGGPARDP